MKTEVKPRRVCIRKKRNARPRGSSCPEQLVDPTEKTKSDTDKNMPAIFNLLRRKKNAKLEHLVLNSISFAQTVENYLRNRSCESLPISCSVLFANLSGLQRYSTLLAQLP